MTKIPIRGIERETSYYVRTDPIVIKWLPKTVQLRLKGKREVVELDYGAIMELGQWRRFWAWALLGWTWEKRKY